MKFRLSEYDAKKYQRMVNVGGTIIYIYVLVNIILFTAELVGFYGYLLKLLCIVAFSAIFLVFFDLLHKKPYRNLEKYFLEITDSHFILSHPSNTDHRLPNHFEFSIDDVESISENINGKFDEIHLNIKKPKLNFTLRIWGFEDMSRISNEIHKLMNIRDRKKKEYQNL